MDRLEGVEASELCLNASAKRLETLEVARISAGAGTRPIAKIQSPGLISFQLPQALPLQSLCGVPVQAHRRQLPSIGFQLSKQFSLLKLCLYIQNNIGVDIWTS